MKPKIDKYGFALSKNKKWKEQWKDIVSSDRHWDWVYFVRIVVHKLTLMRDYFKSTLEAYSLTWVDGYKETIDELNMTIDLGLKLLNEDNYYLDSYNFLIEHCHNAWDTPENKERYYEMCAQASDKYNKDYELFWKLISDKSRKWWD